MILIILALILTIIAIVTIYICQNQKDAFINNLSIVDPLPVYLHKNISEKEDWWHNTNSRKLYYYSDMIPQHYKE